MLGKIQDRLTYANVMSSLAVFLVLAGGVGLAASALRRNSVKSKHIAPNAVKGHDAAEATFGTVPTAARATNADQLDGLEPAAFLPASAIGSETMTITDPTEGDGPTAPVSIGSSGPFTIEATCNDFPGSAVDAVGTIKTTEAGGLGSWAGPGTTGGGTDFTGGGAFGIGGVGGASPAVTNSEYRVVIPSSGAAMSGSVLYAINMPGMASNECFFSALTIAG